MKKYLMSLLALVLAVGTLTAKPVDINTAKMVGQKFAQTTLGINSEDLNLVYTVNTDRGEASMYVFNVGNSGFVVVSADDNFRPVVGYSKSDIFDPNNISPEMLFYMEALAGGRSQAKHPDERAAEEWHSVMNYGRALSYNGGKGVDYLVQTRWNQDPAPYNSMCPADPQGPGGHVYVGCVATAMAQLMNYWKYPAQGQGSHSYYCPGYGTQSVNFGATTYDWDNMLNSYSAGSYSPEQGNAVALLGYHCGVAVDMQYDGVEGSGTDSGLVPNAIKNYFKYSTYAQLISYSNLNYWQNTLKEQFDLGWPVYYSGYSSEGGHAFVCDGYNDANYFHFNWGWGGYKDNWFIIGDIEYSSGMRAVINFVPTDVYLNTAQAPTNVNAVKASDVAQEATITWTNPSKTLNNTNLTAIDQIVLERDGRVIYTVDNPTPGANMTFVDNDVPCYSTFEYKVYAIVGGARGKAGIDTESFGPTCQWTIVATAAAMQGWKGGKIVAYDGAGREITSVTMTGNNPTSFPVNITLGRVSFAWVPGSDAVTLSFKIKDPAGNTVYEFQNGSSSDLPEGILYTGNNGCGNPAPTEAPGELFSTADGDDVILTWDSPAKTDYGVNIYRDGYLFGLSQTNEFVDVNPGIGGHCYHICYLTDSGESPFSNESCANVGEGCDTGSDLWYDFQASGKPIITWELPENNEGLSGFYIFRKMNEDGEYAQIKIVGANKTQYKESSALVYGNYYYYKVIPYYQAIDCHAAPIKARYGNQYYVRIHYSAASVDETAAKVNLYPNPTKESFTVEAENLQGVMVYNTIGQMVYRQACEGNSTVIDLGNVDAGIYMVKVITSDGEFVQKISVVK